MRLCRVRRYLRSGLRSDGWPVNMVGTKKSGGMKDKVRRYGAEGLCAWFILTHYKDHEAVPGDVIDTVRRRLKDALGFKVRSQ